MKFERGMMTMTTTEGDVITLGIGILIATIALTWITSLYLKRKHG
ncbi:hypothetical protein SAMN05421676_102419 [Salinibacillus kushneri]|uniref:Uncharacterized protein n=1 Tax=Salinibacillus kushneri TaxID=237682 RepID=A0A1I0BCB7_9BACI|nr:hypothetical protein SAMN05421676_102419 [Salinibacillus kushneri]